MSNAGKLHKIMTLLALKNEYKKIANEMKEEAKNYKYLAKAVRRSHSQETFVKYEKSWRKLLTLNENAYSIMYNYRSLCNSFAYRCMFFWGILPKQHTFIFTDEKKVQFKYTQLLSLIDIA